jgi:hypothetical protein
VVAIEPIGLVHGVAVPVEAEGEKVASMARRVLASRGSRVEVVDPQQEP